MLPRDSLYVRPLVLGEDLSGVPTALLDLNQELAHPKTLPSRIESDVALLSSILRLSCEEEAVLKTKTHFFVLMLMAMMREAEGRLFTIGNIDIALPRHPRAHLETLADWLPKTCTAAAISMIALDSPKARSHCATPPETPLIEEETSTTSEEVDVNAMDVDINDGKNSRASSPNASSGAEEDSGIDCSAEQLHLLAHPSASTPFCIPVVCMASYETILEVMASALHQRRVWGLAETPILGLAFHPRSTRLQMFWGWFEDPDTGEDNCVPIPQVAYRATPLCARATSLFDSYDLADGASALALAQVLYSLHPHFLPLRLAGNNTLCPGIAHVEPPVWRADAPMIRIDQPTLLVRINSWLKNMEVPTPSVLAPSSPSPPSPPSSPSSSSSLPSSSSPPMSGKNQKAKKASTATPESSVQGDGLKESPRSGPSRGTRSHDSSSHSLEVPPFTPFNAPSVAESRRSASTFSHPQSDDSYHKVHYWCLWRAVFMHTMNGPPGDDSDERPWYPALHKYYALAKPDYTLSAHGKEQFEASRIASHSGSYDQLIELLKSGHQNTGDLTERCVLALAPTILLVVELAKGLRSAAKYLGNSLVPESSWRCIWDFLTAIVLIQLEILEKSKENAEVVDMLEQNMRLPHADKGLVELSAGRAAKYNSCIYRELAEEFNTVEEALETATTANPNDTQRLQTLLKQAECASQYHGQAFSTWSTYCRGITTCDHKEAPMRARVDGAWALVLKDVFDKEPMASYLRDNPHFLPLDISPNIFRFQSHAPEYVRSFLHRSNVFEKDLEGLSDAQKLHFMTDTMIGGVLGPASSADPDDHLARRMLREAHNFDRVITEARKAGTGGRLPRVPLPSDLLVPFFIREYKRLLDHPKDSGVTQCRMALVAATKFLGKLGVTLCPTYGLVTEGDLGSVHMAIGVPKKDFLKLTPTVDEDISVHVFERGCNMFQLSTEEGAIAYVAFLVGLHTTARTDLATKLHDVKDHLRQCLRKDPASPHLSWSMQQHPDVIQEEERKAKLKAKSAPVLADSVDVEDDTIQPSDIGL